jgi:hypothetical protein
LPIKIGYLEVRKLTPRLLWDLFMVWVAVINLCLILFDLTYLMLRPFYFRHVPVVTTYYDQVKGIKPHPLSEEVIAQAQVVTQQLERDPGSPELALQLASLEELSLQLLEENPFAACGQSRNLDRIRALIAGELDQEIAAFGSRRRWPQLMHELWSGSPEVIGTRLALFEQEIRPLLEVSYFREYGLSGRPVDHFWLLDMPFLALFWIEFLVRWVTAIRRRTHAKWFFFPIFYWYDLLGLVPNVYFRPFRLLRVASIYMRLRRSQLTKVGDDFISDTVEYISNIITEEVSDMVSLRILNEYQEELRSGTHMKVFEQTIGTRRAEIHQVLARQIRDVLTNEDNLAHFGELLRLNLRHAVERSEALRSVPLPMAVLRPVARAIGEVLLETLLETVSSTIDSEQGQEMTQALVASVVDQLLTGPGLVELEKLGKEISLDIFEHMKETVAVKKWTQS